MKKQAINRITKPISSDTNPNYQSPESPRDSLNGTITGRDGMYEWSNKKGDVLAFTLGSDNYILGWCVVRNTIYCLTISKTIDSANLYSIAIPADPSSGFSTSVQRWTGSQNDLNLSEDYPIKRMLGFYENEDMIRIYWTDGNSQPGTLTVPATASILDVTTDDKFIPWAPIIEGVYGSLNFEAIIANGNLYHGTYFFVWQYYTNEGYYTDWSPISNPINLINHATAGTTVDDYHDIQGGEYNVRSSKGIQISIDDIDDDYDNIRVGFFFSGDQNIIDVGTIFIDEEITASSMTFELFGGELFGEITVDDLISKSITLKTIQDFDFIKYKNVIANFSESEDLTIGNKFEVDITEEDYSIMLDTMGSPVAPTSTSFTKSIAGIKNIDSYSSGNIPSDVWYKVTSATATLTGISTSTVWNYTLGDRFKLTEICALTAGGTIVPLIRIKKFRYGTATTPYADTDYEWEEIEVDDQFYNFKNPLFGKKLKGYPSDQNIRLGILPFDLEGKPMYVRWLKDNTVSDYTTSKRSNSNKLVTFPADNYASNSADQVNGNVRSLIISDLDITDIADKISGFSIVRAPIISKTVATGIINRLIDDSDDIKTYPEFVRTSSGETSRFLNWYSLYSPEQLFALKDFQIAEGDYLENLYYLVPFEFTNDQGTHEFPIATSSTYYQKFLLHTTDQGSASNGMTQAENEIDDSFPYKIGDGDDISFDGSQPVKVLRRLSTIQVSRSEYGYNNKLLLVKTKNSETISNPVGPFDNTTPYALVVAIKRSNSNPYGGTSDAALANTEYISTGHFQPVNATILGQINDGSGNYVFNEIQVFGGDQFVSLCQNHRLYRDKSDLAPTFSHAIIWPVESKINLDLREGNHLSNLRSYDSTYNTSGIRSDLTWADVVFEDFDYNDGYSTDNIGDIYPAVPFINTLINKFDTGIRWSNNKSIGEAVDNFRKFAINNFKLIDTTNLGPITNVRENGDYLIYWQEQGLGYLPVSERAMQSSALGAPVQLGVGGNFERNDILDSFIGGNLHSFGLVKSEMGFHWFDFNNMIFITMPKNMQLSQESIVKGLDNFFKENIDPDLRSYNSPLTGYGIVGGYDPIEKEIFVSFIQPDGNDFGIIYSLRTGGFGGRFNEMARNYLTSRNLILKLTDAGNSCYMANYGNYNTFMGQVKDAYVEIVVNDEQKISKIFDNFEQIGSENFDKIEFETEDGVVTEIIADTSGVLNNRNYKNIRNKLMQGNIPKNSTRKRLNGFYLKIRFYVSSSRTDNKKVSLVQLNTNYRKAY